MSAELRLSGTPAIAERPLASRKSASAGSRLADVVQRNVFVVLVLCAAGALLALLVQTAIASDSWYSLLGGRIVADSGIPHHDALTVLAHGREWVDQQWLGHLALYALWSLGGWPLATLALAAAYLGALTVGVASARSHGASERSATLVLIACFIVGLPNTALRAQVLAYPLFALVLALLLADDRARSRRVFLVFPLLVLWANVHGSVVVGAAIVSLQGALLAFSAVRRRVSVAKQVPRAAFFLLAPWACVLASPYALALPGYYQRTLANRSFDQLVFEWTPSTVRNEPIFFAVLLVALWLAFGYGRALRTFARLALLLSAFGGLVAIRNIVWFALIAVAVLPRALDAAIPPRQTERHKRFNLALAALAVAGLTITAAATAAHGRDWFERGFPAKAGDIVSEEVAANPQAGVFANERYADWLLFEHPNLRGRVAYDIRFELYTSRELRGIYDFTLQRGLAWRRIATGYDVFVLDPTQQKSVIRFYARRLHAQWLYRDRQVVVLKLPTQPRR
jgi:hypothetical protein